MTRSLARDNQGVSLVNPSLLSIEINAALPQTQCMRCGYPDCASYADAIAVAVADINQCPPGGAEGIARLSAITGRAALPLNPANGAESPRSIAVIDENWCIGCTLCLDVCPTDAILGSNKLMHTVIERHCTGCELCIPVCPVDCIGLEQVTGNRTGWDAWSQQDADHAATRYIIHSARRNQNEGSSEKRLAKDLHTNTSALAAHVSDTPVDSAGVDRKLAVIEAAMARARAARHGKA